ncbi:zinc finger BED domain-containing protein DAYSLEEPER-like [Papaver somniferum]|uniref:zinc finger BED domain-containing protein DAYSLEEPER-like n=1 Tax=Papaver somniferum TaxID=3469 RepID=UPI000E6FD69C|nr:zinc finger BED domain-containing protein DAYSLEEPER-like [Papaver somniferum]
MASSTQGPSIPVNNPNESIGTTTPATVESIATATVTSTPSRVEVSKPPKASGKKQSYCWQHFSKRLDLKPPKVECKHCKQRFSWGKDASGGSNTYGTTNMNNHIKKIKCPQFTPPGQQQLTFQISDDGETHSVVTHSFDQDACRASLTRMIIKCELPFILVQREGFQEFFHQLEPRFEVPSRYTEARDCMKMYLSEYHRLKAEFKKYGRRFSLTTDTWSSVTNMSYMVLTGHYIDENWVLQKKILNLCPVTDHTGLELGKTVASCLLQWGIERVFTMTVDNINSNN